MLQQGSRCAAKAYANSCMQRWVVCRSQFIVSIYLPFLSLCSADIDYFCFAQQVIAPLKAQYFLQTKSGSTVCCSSLVKRWGNANGG